MGVIIEIEEQRWLNPTEISTVQEVDLFRDERPYETVVTTTNGIEVIFKMGMKDFIAQLQDGKRVTLP